MVRSSVLAAVVLALAPACSQAQPAGEEAATTPAAFRTKVFNLPAGSHPHDAAPGPAGQIWYTAQQQGALGIIDVASGKVRQVPLGPSSAPHGVIQAKDGTAWITDGGQNAIVRYDPKTEKIDVWKLPESSGYANLNTGAFAGDGTFWFTGQNGIYGRVPPGRRGAAGAPGRGCTTSPASNTATSTAPRATFRRAVSSSDTSTSVRRNGCCSAIGLATRTAVRRGSSAGRPMASHCSDPTNGYERTWTSPSDTSRSATARRAR